MYNVNGRPLKGQLVSEAWDNNVEGVKRALAEGQSVNTEHFWSGVVGRFQGSGDEINSYSGLTAFFAATVKGYWEVVRVLAEQPGINLMSSSFGCDTDLSDRGETWLHEYVGEFVFAPSLFFGCR